jgi:multidrug resistance efflux pump
MVQVNQVVEKDAPLFQLDPRPLKADLVRAEIAVTLAEQQLTRLKSLPRKEDLAPLQAALQRTTGQVAFARREFDRLARLTGGAVSDEQRSDKSSALDRATADRDEAKANLDRALAGAWEPDLRIASLTLEQAKAEQESIQVRLNRLTVRAPIAGTILKRNLEPGEYANPAGQPVLVLGNVAALNVRAFVHEQDVPSLPMGARGTAIVIGEKRYAFPLTMLRVEPLAVPKTQLTNVRSELVDTRVVEVLFRVDPAALKENRLYPGQMVDVFIDATPVPTGSLPSRQTPG